MRITGYVWLDEIVDKLLDKHGVDPVEVEEVLEGKPHFRFVEKGHRANENVYAALGQTAGGRCLIVFYVHKQDGRALVLSARTMTERERKRYEQR